MREAKFYGIQLSLVFHAMFLWLLTGDSLAGDSCDAVVAKPIIEIPAGGIVKWTDDAGITHYQDYHGKDAPAGKTLVTQFPDIKDYFSLNIEVVGGSVSEKFKRQVQQRGIWVYEQYKNLLDRKWLKRSQVNLVFYKEQQAYLDHRNKSTVKGLNNVPGFYQPQQNLAVVLYTGDKSALGIATHEITHIINNQLFGDLPRWLNEGVAIYMEHRSSGNKKVALNKEALRKLKTYTRQKILPSTSVEALLTATHADWTAEKHPSYYQLSQTLTLFLLEPGNHLFFKELFNQTAQRKCEQFDVTAFFEREFEGGVSALEQELIQWL